MTDSTPSGSPLDAVASGGESQVADTFSLLGNETRLAILLVLWEARDPETMTGTLPFSRLRDRVGLPRGRQFNYHLEKLVGTFVEKTDDGYGLRFPGLLFVRSIIAGGGIDDPTLERTQIDVRCEICGAPTAVSYDDNRLTLYCTECEGRCPPSQDCPSGALMGGHLEPAGLAHRTAEELFSAFMVKIFASKFYELGGICSNCTAPIETSLEVCEDHDGSDSELCAVCNHSSPAIWRTHCATCKVSKAGPPRWLALFHPAVVAFYYDHGMEIGLGGRTDEADILRYLELSWTFETEALSVEPPRIQVTVSRDGDHRHLVLDGTGAVIDVTDGTAA